MTRSQHAAGSPDIAGLLDVLERHGVRYVLVGSVAALAYGADVGPVGDLDITPALDEENLGRLAVALEEIEAELDPEGASGHWETRPDGERKWVADDPTAERDAQLASWKPNPSDATTFDSLFRSRLGNFDIVPDVSGAYETLMKRAAHLSVWGHSIWVVHVDELLAALTVPRRAKDGLRVRQLREIQRRHENEPTKGA